jgi:ubiquitin carboxyl-terminal hydrolase 14
MPAVVFKGQLQSLTGVEPERQKIMVKGGMLKDDTDLNKLGIKDGHQFMVCPLSNQLISQMMGTAGGDTLKEPPKKTVFVEDMTESELAMATDLPPGLVNLGNTCYMNATLQAMRVIPELQEALKAVTVPMGLDARKNVAVSLKQLFAEMSNTMNPITPLIFLSAVRQAYPQFAEAGRGGVMMQQDAEELYTSVKSCLKELVPGRTLTGEVTKDDTFVRQFMEGKMETTLTCDDTKDEDPITTKEDFQTLQLAVSGGGTGGT